MRAKQNIRLTRLNPASRRSQSLGKATAGCEINIAGRRLFARPEPKRIDVTTRRLASIVPNILDPPIPALIMSGGGMNIILTMKQQQRIEIIEKALRNNLTMVEGSDGIGR
jgi:hypothetical protein